ncbi:AAA family ATPase [Clostridium perfringens]|uniref:AAA family ATPase n=1 Tax=Clostridium perfringens TaxID=1502 RepID=UPI00096A81A4|nr:AAA family ATPase [Clostridium perfringens]
MKISRLRAENFLGIRERELDLKKINYVKGPKGSGKTSIVEAVEKVFTNKNRRTELVRHGEIEACLYVKTDDGLEIDRKIRTEKSDYLRIRKNEIAAPSTERFLRGMIQGEIFRPLDWINLSVKEQTKSILAMLEIGWSMEQINEWFGEVPSGDNINYDMHILQILKAIESKYFKERETVNREIRELEIQVKGMMDELPAGYDGDKWRDKKLQEYYAKVTEAQKINYWIEEAKTLKENFESKVASIKAQAEGEKSKVKLKYAEQKQDIKDIIELSKGRIEKSNVLISNANERVEFELSKLDNELEAEYQALLQKYTELKDRKKKEIQLEVNEAKDIISINESKISAKEQELLSLDELMDHEYASIDEKGINAIELEKARLGKASEYLENNTPVDIEPLQAKAEEVERMQSFLREYDKMVDIRDGLLERKRKIAADYTVKIEKARTLPTELLKTASMPIEGISVDANGLIRINGTLIDGLSDGEKLELSLIIAKAQCGELKLICLDRFESLNEKERINLINQMVNDDYQYILTSTESDELEIVQFDTEEEIRSYFEGGKINE